MAAALRQRYGKDRVAVVVSRYDQMAEIGRKDIERVMGGPIVDVFPSNYRLALDALNNGRPLVLDNHNKLAGVVRHVCAQPGSSVRAPEALRPSARRGLLGRLNSSLRRLRIMTR